MTKQKMLNEIREIKKEKWYNWFFNYKDDEYIKRKHKKWEIKMIYKDVINELYREDFI